MKFLLEKHECSFHNFIEVLSEEQPWAMKLLERWSNQVVHFDSIVLPVELKDFPIMFDYIHYILYARIYSCTHVFICGDQFGSDFILNIPGCIPDFLSLYVPQKW